MKETLKITVLSNFTLEPYFYMAIQKFFCNNNEEIELHYVSIFETDLEENKIMIENSSFVVLWINIEQLLPDLQINLISQKKRIDLINQEVMTLLDVIINNFPCFSTKKIFWLLFEDYYSNINQEIGNLYDGHIDYLNNKILSTFQGFKNIVFLDLKHIIASVGIKNTYSNINKYRWDSIYSQTLMEMVSSEIYKQYLIFKGITPKCLVLDCDNVLWGGVLSEEGVENLRLGNSGAGRIFQDFQRLILSLYYKGVLLAICSKNNFNEVIHVFQNHSGMILKENNIACFQVNWSNKAENIKAISSVLNIGLDSIVFVDDSPHEIAIVNALLPNVKTVLFDFKSIYNNLSCFNLKNDINIKDVENRNQTFKTDQYRKELKLRYKNQKDFAQALDLRVDIHLLSVEEIGRISELTQRTNKCTNGQRYDKMEINNKCKRSQIYSVYAEDKFSNLGLVGAMEVEGTTLTLFCLSCRALGRNVENEMMEFLLQKHCIDNIWFRSTSKNNEIKEKFFEKFPKATIKYI